MQHLIRSGSERYGTLRSRDGAQRLVRFLTAVRIRKAVKKITSELSDRIMPLEAIRGFEVVTTTRGQCRGSARSELRNRKRSL